MVQTDDALGELLVSQGLMSAAQLKTAAEFQKSLGGDLKTIVVKLGYVRDTDLAGLMAQQQSVPAASSEITEQVIDFVAIRQLPRELLEKHQVLPLRSAGNSLVLAMADPNDLRAIEEIQFLVNRTVEPAVATRAAIRRALNQLDELAERAADSQDSGEYEIPLPDFPPDDSDEVEVSGGDDLERLRSMPFEKLMRAYVLHQVEAGLLNVRDLLAAAERL